MSKSLVDALNENFIAATAADLRGYCDELGVKARSNSTEEWMIGKIRSAFENRPMVQVGNVRSTEEVRNINLRPVGRWGGRRRRVVLNEIQDGSPWVNLSWDQNQILVKRGAEVALPYPHYQVLLGTVAEHLSLKFNDQTRNVDRETKMVQSVPFQDLGDDPETAHLPRSWIERQQSHCRANGYYANLPRRQLDQILVDLTDGAISRADRKDMSDEELRERVVVALGLHDEMQNSEFAMAA
jgi:hypothetical protein